MHNICIKNLANNASGSGLQPLLHQAIIWTIFDLLLIEPMRKFSVKFLLKEHIFIPEIAFENVSLSKWQLFGLDLNVSIRFNSNIYILYDLVDLAKCQFW